MNAAIAVFRTSVRRRIVLSALLTLILTTANPAGVLAGPVTSHEWKKQQNFDPQLQMVVGEDMKDGEAFIRKMNADAEALNDYSVFFETLTFKPDSTVTEAGNLYFKKPKMMRIEETGEFNKGSVAVIGKDGKARAHSGGLTSFVTLTMKPDDKMLDAANGDRMEDSDFVSLARVLSERLKQGAASRVSTKPMKVEGVLEPAYVLELYKANDPKSVLKRVFVHPTSNLPIRWDDYDYPHPCLSTWRHIKINVGLSDNLFKL